MSTPNRYAPRRTPTRPTRDPSRGELSARGAERTESFYRRIEADPERTAAALARVDHLGRAVDALRALGLPARRLSSRRQRGPGRGVVCGIAIAVGYASHAAGALSDDVNAFALPGHIKLVWSVSIRPDFAGGCYLSIAQSAVATDAASTTRLRAGWPLLGALVAQQTRQALTAIAELAEDETT